VRGNIRQRVQSQGGNNQMSDPVIIEVDEEEELKCPTCGKAIVAAEEVVPQPSCKHIRFIYANGEAFEYIDPELEAQLELERAQDEDFDEWDALKAHTGPGSVILEQTEEGMACGPVSFIVWVGIWTKEM
jgi:hypothetical protein